MLWTSERGRRWRHGWSAGDWVGFAFLVVGAITVAARLPARARSSTWL